MNQEPKDIIILGAIKHGIKKFDKIQKTTQTKPEELNTILEQLENSGFILVEKRKGWLGMKTEIIATKKGINEVNQRVHELQTKWNQISAIYKTGNKEMLKQKMDENKSSFPTMMFFGVMDMMMFLMVLNMIGMAMSDYVTPENMSETGDEVIGDDDGFDFDIGF